MAHYKVNTSHGLVEFDSPHADLNQSEVETIINQNHPAVAQQQPAKPSALHSFFRSQALPIAAGTITGMATSSASPLVSAPSAALAGAAGEAYRQIGLRVIGDETAPQTSTEAAKLIGQRGLEQGAAELGGRAIGAVAKPLLGFVGKGAAAGAKGLTKLPAENFTHLFNNPSELLTAPFKSTISKAYGKVGFLAEGTLEQAAKDATTSNSGFIRAAMKEIEKPFSEVNPKKLFDARKAVDAELDMAKFFGGPKQARSAIKSKVVSLQQVRQGLNQALDVLAEGGNADAVALRKADALMAKGAVANSFRSLVPRVNVMQSVPRFLTAPLVVPAVAGGATALAGAAYKAVPYIARTALSAGANPLLEAMMSRRKK